MTTITTFAKILADGQWHGIPYDSPDTQRMAAEARSLVESGWAESRMMSGVIFRLVPWPLDSITLTLTEYQASEVQCGLDIDAADHPGEPLWGRVTPVGKRGYCLAVAGTQLARDRALYRITSSRDIALDNARSRFSSQPERLAYGSQGRSLESLTARLIEAAGGPEGFSDNVRRWIRYY